MAAGALAGADIAEDTPTLESEFFEMLIASERVINLVDQIMQANTEHKLALKRRRQAVLDLAAAVEAKESYAVEARLAGAVDVVTALLKDITEDEELTRGACTIITACSGALSCGGKVQDFAFGSGLSVRVRERSLADGLGVRVWAIAHCLVRELVREPGLVQGKAVLEIGAGTGLCGLVAAKLGASKVVLTDYEDKVLLNLRDCVAVNAATAAAQKPPTGGGAAAAAQTINNEELFGEGADECDDLDGFLGAAMEPNEDGAAQQASWDFGNMHVRYMNWNDDLQRLRKREVAAGKGAALPGGTAAEEGQMPPALGCCEAFDVVLGSDVLYEMAHAEMVAAVLALRLRRAGLALIGVTVRDQAVLDDVVGRVGRLGMRVLKRQVEPCLDTPIVLGNARDYEGGFVLLSISWGAAADSNA